MKEKVKYNEKPHPLFFSCAFGSAQRMKMKKKNINRTNRFGNVQKMEEARAVCYIYIRKNERIKCNWVLVLVPWALVNAIRMANGYESVNGCILGEWTESGTEENKKEFDRDEKQWKQHFQCKRHSIVYLKWKGVKRALYNWLPLPLKNNFWFTFSKVPFLSLSISLAIDTQTHFYVRKKKLLLFSALTFSLSPFFYLCLQKWFTYTHEMCRISLFISCTFNLKLKAQTSNWCEKISDRREEKKNKMKHLILFYLKDVITSFENGWWEWDGKSGEKSFASENSAPKNVPNIFFHHQREKLSNGEKRSPKLYNKSFYCCN